MLPTLLLLPVRQQDVVWLPRRQVCFDVLRLYYGCCTKIEDVCIIKSDGKGVTDRVDHVAVVCGNIPSYSAGLIDWTHGTIRRKGRWSGTQRMRKIQPTGKSRCLEYHKFQMVRGQICVASAVRALIDIGLHKLDA